MSDIVDTNHSSPENAVWNFAQAILHGDAEHRRWLLDAARAFECGKPLPAVRGSGAPAQRALNPEALAALKNYTQADDDGVMVNVSRQALDEAIAALTSTQAPAQRQPFAWLIEKEFGSVLHYYAPTEPGEWTRDHLKACRFARKQDAEAIQFRHVARGHLPEGGTRVCEHGWMDHPAVTSTDGGGK